MIDLKRVYEHINAVQSAATAEGAIDAIYAAASLFGIDYLVVTGLPIPGRDIGPLVVATLLPQNWLSHYLENRLADADPCVRTAFTSVDPFLWRDARPQLGREAAAARVMAEAAEYGMKTGVTIPIHTEDGFTAAVSFAGAKTELDARAIESLQICAYIGHGHLRSLTGKRFEKISLLSPREAEVLSWAAMGKTNDDIATIMSVARRTVEEHLRAAVGKLDSGNVKQAIANAIIYRQIRL